MSDFLPEEFKRLDELERQANDIEFPAYWYSECNEKTGHFEVCAQYGPTVYVLCLAKSKIQIDFFCEALNETRALLTALEEAGQRIAELKESNKDE